MCKNFAVMLALIFLTASSLMMAKPAFSSADATGDSWVSKAPLQQARGGLGVVAVNGKIYAIGGTTAAIGDSAAGHFVGTNEEYDPEMDKWTYKASMPTPRDQFAIVAYGNKIYCIGGAVGFTVDEYGLFHSYVVSGVNEVYDTVTGTWEAKKSLPYSGMGMQAHVVNGKIFVVDESRVYVYDPDKDSWAAKTVMPEPHPQWDSWPVSAVVDDKIIITFEYYPLLGSPEQKILIYDTETDSWSGGVSGSTVVALGAAAATTGVKAPQKVYVFGVSGQPLKMSSHVYDLESDVWATATAMPTYRYDFGVAVVNDVLYVIGGYLRSSSDVTPTAVNEQYIPIGYGVPPEVKILSPVNQTYDVPNVSLAFAVNKTASWMGYSLDGRDNVTVNGNTTISGLANGSHNVTVYARDEFGNVGASETVYFSVEVPFPVVPVAAASAASVAVAVAGLLVYLRRRNHGEERLVKNS
jgi:hypothetical protein